MRQLFAIAGLIVLTSCAREGAPADSLPQWITGFPDEGPSFGVASPQQAPTEPGYAGFNKSSPELAATRAAQICTLGYQRLGEETAPGEQVPFTVTRIRCAAYRPVFF